MSKTIHIELGLIIGGKRMPHAVMVWEGTRLTMAKEFDDYTDAVHFATNLDAYTETDLDTCHDCGMDDAAHYQPYRGVDLCGSCYQIDMEPEA